MYDKNIIWLASYPKSGNTWFRIFLTNLLSEQLDPIDINDLRSIPIASSRSIFDEYLGCNSSELTFEEITSLRSEVYKRFSRENKQEVFIKTHDAWSLDCEGKPLFPEQVTKGVIYIIRNPLDLAISYSFHNNHSIDKTIYNINKQGFKLCSNRQELKMQLPQYLDSWSNHVVSWTSKSKLPVHVMRYEDMLENTYSSFKEVLNFLGLRYSKEKVNSAITECSFNNLRSVEEQKGFTERSIHSKFFFRKGIKDEWTFTLSPRQINEIINQNAAVMKKFGYQTELY